MNQLYLYADQSATPLVPKPYALEAELQEIIAKNPQLLLERECGNKQLFLVEKEFTLPEYIGSANNFSLDHLMVDSDGIPTLIEVKRCQDNRIKREVVAQMVDYAARMVSVDAGDLRAFFVRNNPSPTVLAQYDTDEFWKKVEDNLKLERMNLYFVADVIPETLRTMIGFLRRTMKNIIIYGVEIKQYQSNHTTMLSTELLGGPLPEAIQLNAPVSWDAASFANKLSYLKDGDLQPTAEAIRKSSEAAGISIVFGRGAKNPTFNGYLGRLFLFKVQLSPYDVVPKCTLEFCLPDLKKALPGQTEQSLKASLTDYPNREEALSQGDIWFTPQYLYFRLAFFKQHETQERFAIILTKLVKELQSISYI